MRTTITLDDDVAAAVERLRAAEGVGLSEAVNRMLRTSMVSRVVRTPYVHHTEPVGLKVDVTNVGEVLDLLDDEDHSAG